VYLLSPLLFNTDLEFLSRALREEEEIKGTQIGKEVVKLSLFGDNIILYLKTQKNSTKKFRLHKSFSKVAGYKINLQKSVVFLYTNIKRMRKNIGK
jgi:hypothetical protein